MKGVLVAALLSASLAGARAGEVEVRFHPARQSWSYELDAARALRSVTVQNTAIVNRSAVTVEVEQVRYELVRGDEIVVSQALGTADLDAAAKAGNALGASGMLEVLAFQFAPAKLFGGSYVLAATRTLAPGESLHVPAQLLVFRGRPDAVRVTVMLGATAPDAVATLALRHDVAASGHRFPLRGRWIAGAGASPHSHHRWAVPEEFAFDFMRYGKSGGTYRGDGSRPSDYYAYGEPVFASADGKVVAALDTMPDSIAAMRRPGESLPDYQVRLRENQGALLGDGPRALAGNHVVVAHGAGIHSVYAHLKPGSVPVSVGDAVRAGQRIGAVGTSGNSTEPHLHYHLCDAPDPLLCAGLPVAFENIEIPFADGPRQIQSGDLVETLPSPASRRD